MKGQFANYAFADDLSLIIGINKELQDATNKMTVQTHMEYRQANPWSLAIINADNTRMEFSSGR